METFQYSLIICFLAITTLPSCVSKGKFLLSQQHIQRLQRDSSDTHGQLTQCNTDLHVCNTSLDQCNVTRKNLEDQKGSLIGTVENSKMTIADQAKRLKDLQDLIQAQRNAMNKLKKNLSDALVNFKSDELHIAIKDGKVYVSLEEKLLFKSGSDVVDPKGKEAIGKLAMVLNTTEDIDVNIEGHTDTVPIKTAHFQDNWDLSVSRAASIVRILLSNGVDPHRIVASGRGEFHPVATNSTTEGKANNRRTEIIISPNLSEMYKLLEQ